MALPSPTHNFIKKERNMKFNYQTLSQLTQRVIHRLSMFRGTSVQVYAEDRIAQMILDNYTLAFDSFEWSNLQTWYKFTLVGINGWAVENVSDFIKYLILFN